LQSGAVTCPICRDSITSYNGPKVFTQEEINFIKTSIVSLIFYNQREQFQTSRNLLKNQLVSDFLNLEDLIFPVFENNNMHALYLILENMESSNKDISDWIFLSFIASAHIKDPQVMKEVWHYTISTLSKKFTKNPPIGNLYLDTYKKVIKGLTLVRQHYDFDLTTTSKFVCLFFKSFPQLYSLAEDPTILKTALEEYITNKSTNHLILFIESLSQIIYQTRQEKPKINLNEFLKAAVTNLDKELTLYLLNNFSFDFTTLNRLSIDKALADETNPKAQEIHKALTETITTILNKKIDEIIPKVTVWGLATWVAAYILRT